MPLIKRLVRSKRWLAVITTLGLIMAGCASDPSSENKNLDTLTVAIRGENVTNGHLDIHKTQLDESAVLLRNVFDSLVDLDHEGKPVPWLATEWDISDNGLEYVFTLRDDVFFHDGEKFNSKAVVLNFQHVMDPNTKSAYANELLGGDIYAGAEEVSEYVVKIKLNKPFAPLINNLSLAQLGFYSPKVLVDGVKEKLPQGGEDITVGTGPYKIKEVNAGTEISLVANNNYNWYSKNNNANGPAEIKNIDFKILPKDNVRISAFNNGEAQVLIDMQAQNLDQIKTEANRRTAQQPGVPYSLYINDGSATMADANVRTALRYSINTVGLTKALFGDFNRFADSILSESTPVVSDIIQPDGYTYDINKAKSLLAQSGWNKKDSDGYLVKNGERLTIKWVAYTPVAENKKSVANAIIADAKEVGIEILKENLEGGKYMEKYLAHDFDMTDWDFSGIDPDVLRNHLATGGFQNASSVKHVVYDDLLLKGVSSTSNEERKKIYLEVMKLNAKDNYIIPIYVPDYITVSRKSISNIWFDNFGRPSFVSARISN